MERRKFTPEFKRQVVEQAMAAGNNSVVARKYDIRPNVVSKWVRQYKAGQSMQGSSAKRNATHVTKQEHAQLVAENRELGKQNAHLKQLLGEKDLEIAILRDLLKKPTVTCG
ncbi:MAG TPA: transposase [Alicyclobacillus sp.]|nr:transposase [Alicyclobacillus sp.]